MARSRPAAKQPPPPPPALPGRWDHIALAVLGVALAAATVFVVVRDARHDYRFYQREFRRAVERTFGADAARAVPSGPQQIWVAGLQRADRCMTCHQGVGVARLRDGRAAAGARIRPDLSRRTRRNASAARSATAGRAGRSMRVGAHGRVPDWREPLLDDALAAGLRCRGDRRASLIEMNCNVCHRYESRHRWRRIDQPRQGPRRARRAAAPAT